MNFSKVQHTADIPCAMERCGVRPSLCSSTGSQQQTRCCMTVAFCGPGEGRIYRSISAAAACGGRMRAVVKVDRRIRWHYVHYYYTSPSHWCTTTRYRNCKFYNFARTISRHADGISRYSVPPSAGPLLPMNAVSVTFVISVHTTYTV